MASSNSWFAFTFRALVTSLLFSILVSSLQTLGLQSTDERGSRNELGGRRLLLSFRETPTGGNATYECSPSGPCVPCLYSEKNEEKYRCSETGYRIPLKCVELENGSKEEHSMKSHKSRSIIENFDLHTKEYEILQDAEITTAKRHRMMLDDSSTSESGRQAYIIYRSCISPVNEEKLSVLGFEGIMLGLLLISGSFIYLKRKRTVTMPGVGAVRVQTNSRF